MTNNILALDFNGVKIILDANTKLKHLLAPSNAQPISLDDVSTGSPYEVPVGKKGRIIFFTTLDVGALSTLSKTTVVDSLTGAVTIIAAGAIDATNEIFISDSIAAGFFITQGNGNFGAATNLWLIEEDA